MHTLSVDFNHTIGRVKPFHGINNAPIMGTNNRLFHYLGEAGIPYSRLHDTGGRFGGSVFVDISNVFRDFDADPEDPDSYDFAFTDWLLAELKKQGCKPFYRLGATIENSHYIKAYNIFPPVDNLKWAKICEGIIRHYNYGFADGFHYDIKYWEIWNEPDNERDPANNPMWKGNKEQYFKLYEVASNYLKQKFPEIKIGGYGCSGIYGIVAPHVEEFLNVDRVEYFMEFFYGFLTYITSNEHRAPLDFFSWHSYDSVENTILYARHIRETLDQYGFKNTESILDEWNPGTAYRGTEKDAANILEMMTRLHVEPLDMMTYYDGQINGTYQGLFDPVHITIFPAYYSFVAFQELFALGKVAESSCDMSNPPILAAVNEKKGKIVFANSSDADETFQIATPEGWELHSFRILNGIEGMVVSQLNDANVLTIPSGKIAIMEYRRVL